MTVKHEMINVTYNGEGRRFGKWTADCRCRKWAGSGKDKSSLTKSFAEHLEFVKKQN